MSKVAESQISLVNLVDTGLISIVYGMLKQQPESHYAPWLSSGPLDIEMVNEMAHDDWTMCIFLDNCLVGIIGLQYESKSKKHWIHYIVDKEFNGRGIATVALQKFIDVIPRKYAKIYSSVDVTNEASLHVIQRAGFVRKYRRGNTVFLERDLAVNDKSRPQRVLGRHTLRLY